MLKERPEEGREYLNGDLCDCDHDWVATARAQALLNTADKNAPEKCLHYDVLKKTKHLQ
jgi:hypothetical protein